MSFDFMARVWLRLGELLGNRPLTVAGALAGAIFFSSLMGYLLVQQNDNSTDIEKVKSAFCTSSLKSTTNVRQCHRLFDKMLTDPTPHQVLRLRQIVKETP